MTEEIKNVPEVAEEKVDTPEVAEEQEELLSKDEVNRLVAQNKSKAKDEAKKEYESIVNDLKAEIEEIKTSQMPEEEQLSYRQKKEKEEREQRIAELEERERGLEIKENTLTIQSSLAEKKLPTEFVHFLVDTGKHETLEDKLEAFMDVQIAREEEILTNGVKEALSGKAPRISGNSKQIVSQEQFDKMGYSERVALKQKDEDLYNQLNK